MVRVRNTRDGRAHRFVRRTTEASLESVHLINLSTSVVVNELVLETPVSLDVHVVCVTGLINCTVRTIVIVCLEFCLVFCNVLVEFAVTAHYIFIQYIIVLYKLFVHVFRTSSRSFRMSYVTRQFRGLVLHVSYGSLYNQFAKSCWLFGIVVIGLVT
jgi:hypothetical protein